MKKWITFSLATMLALTACGQTTNNQVETTVTSVETTKETTTEEITSKETTTAEASTVEIVTTTEIVTSVSNTQKEEKILYNSLLFDNFGIGVTKKDTPMFMVAFTVENITDQKIMLSPEDYSIGRNGEQDFNVEWWTSASMIEIDDQCNPLADATNLGTAEPHTKYLVTLSFTGTENNPFAGNDFNNYIGYELYYSGLLNDVETDKLIEFSYDYVVPDNMTYQEFVGLV